MIISEPIYETKVLVMIGGTEPDARHAFMEWYVKQGCKGDTLWRDTAHSHLPCKDMDQLDRASQAEPNLDGAAGYLPSEGRIFGLWVGPQAGTYAAELNSVIAHEVAHVAIAVMDNVGIAVSTQHSEALAYYTQFLMREILKGVTGWRVEPPDDQGLWWWWNGDEDSAPIPIHIGYSGTDGSYFAQSGQYGWNRFQPVAEMGGQWMRLLEPAMPQI